jgi:general stress protein 26
MPLDNYEDVTVYALEDPILEQILTKQNECSFLWGTRDHWPMGVIMNYVWHEGKFWLTATSQRARIHAIRRDPRVSIVVSSSGLDIGPGRSITIKGRVEIHDDAETKAWFYPSLAKHIFPDSDDLQQTFVKNLDSDRRVVLEVVPEKWITFDATKMMIDSFPQFAGLR